MNCRTVLVLTAVVALAGFAAPEERQAGAAAKGARSSPAASKGPAKLIVPPGTYKLDPNHALFQWSIGHVGLSDYYVKFTKYDATITLNPAHVEASEISLTIDPASVRTDFPGDWKATHQQSEFNTLDQEIGLSPTFLNGRAHPTITFKSTRVSRTGDHTAKVTGDLTFLGVTRPVTLDVRLIGQVATNEYTHRAVIGLEAKGEIKRTDFGMKPDLLSDAVQIYFNGEFQERK